LLEMIPLNDFSLAGLANANISLGFAHETEDR
jgi:hypothetical protein